MRTVQVSDLKERLDDVIQAVRNGETVEIWEKDICIAEFRPKRGAVDGSVEHQDQAALEPFPANFFTRPLPKAKASVLEQLLEDRRAGR